MKKTIGHKFFIYYEDVDDPITQQKARRQRVARRGETVELSDIDVRRGEAAGAFRQPGEATEDVGGETQASVANKSLEDLVEWLEEQKPTAPQTINAAGDDPAVAERLLEAEETVTGREPRTTVVDGLQRIIDNASSDDADDDDADDDDNETQVIDANLPRPTLNDLAADAGVEEPEKLPNRQAVVDAIEAANEDEDEDEDE
jgi:hypothetical protein